MQQWGKERQRWGRVARKIGQVDIGGVGDNGEEKKERREETCECHILCRGQVVIYIINLKHLHSPCL